jgi:hypothetical protein
MKMEKRTQTLFTPIRLFALLTAAVLLTMLLYLIDSDPPSDTIYEKAVNTAVVFIVVTMLYYAIHKMLKR